ncbi:MAG: hypothetical protein RLZZ227_2937 [Pseudomonadota bacterium]
MNIHALQEHDLDQLLSLYAQLNPGDLPLPPRAQVDALWNEVCANPARRSSHKRANGAQARLLDVKLSPSNQLLIAMKPLFLRPLFALLISMLCLSSAAQEQPDWSQLVGTYEGQVLNGGDFDPVTTTFRVAAGGRLTGQYVAIDESETVRGTLSNARFDEDGGLVLEWTDRYGEGYARLVFAADFSSFDGFWTSLDSEQEFPWNGTRR